MARISPKSPLFRTKEVICTDVTRALNDPQLSLCAKLAIVDQVLWIWSEYDGKYKGCKLWSEEALKNDPENGRLIHEHPVPRKEVRTRLFALNPATAILVRAVLDTYCLGVVVTKREDTELLKAGLNARMPEGWTGENVFARYEAVGIKVCKVEA